jgi:nitrate/TMAO reductase-like tetraheme cytochrome c subunit
MPQLPQRRFHGHHKTVAAGLGGASALPVHGRKDLFTSEKTCIDCHKGIAHHLPDMRGVPGWQ